MPVTTARKEESKDKPVLFSKIEPATPYRCVESGFSNCLMFRLHGIDDRVFYVSTDVNPAYVSYTTGFGVSEVNRDKYHFFKVEGDKITFGV